MPSTLPSTLEHPPLPITLGTHGRRLREAADVWRHASPARRSRIMTKVRAATRRESRRARPRPERRPFSTMGEMMARRRMEGRAQEETTKPAVARASGLSPIWRETDAQRML